MSLGGFSGATWARAAIGTEMADATAKIESSNVLFNADSPQHLHAPRRSLEVLTSLGWPRPVRVPSFKIRYPHRLPSPTPATKTRRSGPPVFLPPYPRSSVSAVGRR